MIDLKEGLYFVDKAYRDYVGWRDYNNVIFDKINNIIYQIKTLGFNKHKNGIGDVVYLDSKATNYYSEIIDDNNRLVFKIDDEKIIILQCYGKKILLDSKTLLHVNDEPNETL